MLFMAPDEHVVICWSCGLLQSQAASVSQCVMQMLTALLKFLGFLHNLLEHSRAAAG